MKMATADGYPLRQGAETGLELFFLNSEASGSGTPDLGFFSGVSIFIEFLASVSRQGGPRVNDKDGVLSRG